jgi:hypothetical protein
MDGSLVKFYHVIKYDVVDCSMCLTGVAYHIVSIWGITLLQNCKEVKKIQQFCPILSHEWEFQNVSLMWKKIDLIGRQPHVSAHPNDFYAR